MHLERVGRDASLSLDGGRGGGGGYTAVGAAPGIHAMLNLDNQEIYVGAAVDVFPGGYTNVNHGFDVSLYEWGQNYNEFSTSMLDIVFVNSSQEKS